MKKHVQQIAAGEFKSKCLHILDQVNIQHIPIIITKRGKPVAKLIPIEEEKPAGLFGYLKGSVIINADIIEPANEKWDANDD